MLESSVLQDLFTSAKNLTIQYLPNFDVLPINGLLYPYLLEHPEVSAVLTRMQQDYFSDYISTALLSLLNSKLYTVIDSGLVIFTHLSLIFVF